MPRRGINYAATAPYGGLEGVFVHAFFNDAQGVYTGIVTQAAVRHGSARVKVEYEDGDEAVLTASRFFRTHRRMAFHGERLAPVACPDTVVQACASSWVGARVHRRTDGCPGTIVAYHHHHRQRFVLRLAGGSLDEQGVASVLTHYTFAWE